MEHINDIKHQVFNRTNNRANLSIVHPQPQAEEVNVGDWEEDGLIDGEDGEDGDELDELDDNASIVEGTIVEKLSERRSRYEQPQPLTIEIDVMAKAGVIPAKPVCPICKGGGFLRENVQFGHPRFGKLKECRCHKEEKKVRVQRKIQQLSQLDVLARFKDATFDNYTVVPSVQQAFNAAVRFGARPRNKWLVLVGPNGCGKTHLAVAAAKDRLADGDTVVIQTVPDLLDYLRSGYSTSAESTYEVLFDRMRRIDFLVLDDLGAQQNSPWATEKIFQLLNYRYNCELPTLITINTIYLSSVDPRVASRLSDRGLVTMVHMDQASDYRPHNTPVEDE